MLTVGGARGGASLLQRLLPAFVSASPACIVSASPTCIDLRITFLLVSHLSIISFLLLLRRFFLRHAPPRTIYD
jgi:hypothetical protein